VWGLLEKSHRNIALNSWQFGVKILGTITFIVTNITNSVIDQFLGQGFQIVGVLRL